MVNSWLTKIHIRKVITVNYFHKKTHHRHLGGSQIHIYGLFIRLLKHRKCNSRLI